MKRRLIATFLSLCLLFTLLPATALAEGETDSGPTPAESTLCEHHPQHDESCGYTAGSEGTPCAHEHGEDCYVQVTNCVHTHTADCFPAESAPEDPAAPAEPAAAEPTACNHVCSAESGCITKVLDCRHAHDAACGYAPAVEGTPCGYVCEICDLQEGGEVEATEPEPTEPELTEPETVCLCSERCTENSVNAGCPVCSAGGADLSACLGEVPAAALAAAPARAQKEVEYVQYGFKDDGTITPVNLSVPATVVESDMTRWEGIWYVVDHDVTFDHYITVQGAASLILADGCELTSANEIIVNEGSSLTIYGQEEGTGALSVRGSRQYAAIGGEPGENCGSITIHGGNITADAGTTGSGAGIGGGKGGNGGEITIYGGTVTATGGTGPVSGAGIGGGNGGSGGTIEIYGGTVIATGGWHGAGIGGGSGGSGGKITIHGGNVTATGHSDAGYGAGIGGGNGGSSGTITITGGTVRANGSYFGGAGIGGGRGSGGDTITITGGMVTANGGRSGVGIGGGSGGIINIDGGTVTATGGSLGGAGIGYGGTITITGGTVRANGGSNYGLISAGIDGSTFSTGEDGNAIIYANSINAGGDPSQWSGIIFQGSSGQVYGDQTLAEDFTVEKNRTLTIADRAGLTVPKEITLTNKGTMPVTGSGILTNHGTLDNREGLVTIAGEDSVVSDGQIIKGPQSTPAAGEGYAIDYEEETITIKSGYEAFTAQSGGTEIPSGDISGSLGQTFYIRKAEYITQNASDWADLPIPARRQAPAAPQVTDRTDTAITISAEDGAEYRLGETGAWQMGTDGSLTFGSLTAGQTYTIYARYAAVTTGSSAAFVSEETSIQAATKSAPGQAPNVTGITVTDTTITLPYDAAWEYSTDGQAWDSTHKFTGLTPATQYTYYVRAKETEYTAASQSVTVTVYTAYAAPAAGTGYTIHFDTETLTIDSGLEVNTAEDFTGTEIASGVSLAGCIGQTIYIRHAADEGGAPASATVSVPIPARPAAPSVTGGILKINGADTTMEYSTDQGAAWTAFTAETVSSINAGTYWVRYAAVAGTSFASERVEVTVTRRSSGTSVTTYSVIVADTEHGAVTVSHKQASRNTPVTITVSPDEGYELESLTVTDGDGDEVDLTRESATEYTFGMPRSRVTVEASFAGIAPEPLPFGDVDDGDWFADAVRFVYENGMMNGVSETGFAPHATTSRSMIVTILYRLEGEPVVDDAMDFADVAGDAWCTDAVRWAAGEGIVGGYGDGLFGPDDPVTREQLAAILYRYAVYKGYDVSVGEDTNILSYDDFADLSEYAIPAMQWACGAGIVNGTSESTFTPQGEATRAQVAAMMMRFCENTMQ